MKRIVVIVLAALLLLGGNIMEVNAEFTLNDVVHDTETIDGVTYGHIEGTIEDRDGNVSNQVINYLSANPKLDPTLNIIAADAYQSLSYSTATLPTIINQTNSLYSNYEVIGGVNGDYYNMVVGIPVEAYVRNFEVVSSGLGYERPVVGFKDNGEVIFGRPCFQGMELLVYNQDGDLKNRVDVERVNNLPYSEQGTTVFFQNYEHTIETNFTKIVIDATDYKTDGYNTRYFGKGNFEDITNQEIDVDYGTFVIVSENPYIKDLIEDSDRVVVQEKMGCDFEGVRFALGVWEELVVDGVATNNIPTGTAPASANPRTAIGVKSDGTVILVAIDGRQSSSGMDGMSLYDVADLFVSMGVETAYSLDGGGSTIMSVKNGPSSYEIVNSPSDGAPRRLSNAILFVRGAHTPIPTTLPLPDLSTKLEAPSSIYVDQDNVLRFSKVNDSDGYIININGEEYETKSRDLPLNLPEGEYTIKIKTVGDGLIFGDSDYSDELIVTIYKEDLESIIELFTNYAKNETK